MYNDSPGCVKSWHFLQFRCGCLVYPRDFGVVNIKIMFVQTNPMVIGKERMWWDRNYVNPWESKATSHCHHPKKQGLNNAYIDGPWWLIGKSSAKKHFNWWSQSSHIDSGLKIITLGCIQFGTCMKGNSTVYKSEEVCLFFSKGEFWHFFFGCGYWWFSPSPPRSFFTKIQLATMSPKAPTYTLPQNNIKALKMGGFQ